MTVISRCCLPLIIGLCVLPVVAAQASECNQYEPADATLAGTLTRQVFPGPPGFEDVVTGDEPLVGYYLSLSEPLCMQGNENEADISVEDSETLVQLVLQATDYDNLRPYLDQPVVLKGTLFGAVSGFHHTQVLMQQVQLVSGMVLGVRQVLRVEQPLLQGPALVQHPPVDLRWVQLDRVWINPLEPCAHPVALAFPDHVVLIHRALTSNLPFSRLNC